jgi:gluconate 2-dehydrogenase gamma chain
MSHDPLSRRRFVGTVAATLAATWMAGAARPGLVAAAPVAAGPVLASSQLRDLDAIAALILPGDDSPGAREAHVVDFIDRALGTFAADQRPLFDAGLADLNARVARRHPVAGNFADLPEADAAALVRELEGERSDFFEAVRVATISGFLANPEYGGNAGKIGWRAIGFDDRFVWAEPFGWYDGEGAAGE